MLFSGDSDEHDYLFTAYSLKDYSSFFKVNRKTDIHARLVVNDAKKFKSVARKITISGVHTSLSLPIEELFEIELPVVTNEEDGDDHGEVDPDDSGSGDDKASQNANKDPEEEDNEKIIRTNEDDTTTTTTKPSSNSQNNTDREDKEEGGDVKIDDVVHNKGGEKPIRGDKYDYSVKKDNNSTTESEEDDDIMVTSGTVEVPEDAPNTKPETDDTSMIINTVFWICLVTVIALAVVVKLYRKRKTQGYGQLGQDTSRV